MPTECTAAGLWDQISGAPYMSKQQWMAANLLILCEILFNQGTVPSMSSCTVTGLWNQIGGNPPYLSEQQFMAENISLLCQIMNAGGTGGGGNVNPVYHGASPPAAPAIPGQAALYAPDDDTLPFQVWIPGTGWTVR